MQITLRLNFDNDISSTFNVICNKWESARMPTQDNVKKNTKTTNRRKQMAAEYV